MIISFAKVNGGGGSGKALKPIKELPEAAENGTLVSLHKENWNTIVSTEGMANVVRRNFPAGYQVCLPLEGYLVTSVESYNTQEHFDNYEADTLLYGFYVGSEEAPSEGHTLRIALNRLTEENYTNQIMNGEEFWGCPMKNGDPGVEIFGGEDAGFHSIYDYVDSWITLSGVEFMYDSSVADFIFRGDNLSWRNGTDEEAGRREYGDGSQKYQIWVSFSGEVNDYESVPFENGQLGYIDTINFPVSVGGGVLYTFNVRMECYGEILGDGNYYIKYILYNADAPAYHTNFERSAIYSTRASGSGNWAGYGYSLSEELGLFYKEGVWTKVGDNVQFAQTANFILNNNGGAGLQIWVGSQEEYDALDYHYDDIIYIIR